MGVSKPCCDGAWKTPPVEEVKPGKMVEPDEHLKTLQDKLLKRTLTKE
jgi:hypothetical protein